MLVIAATRGLSCRPQYNKSAYCGWHLSACCLCMYGQCWRRVSRYTLFVSCIVTLIFVVFKQCSMHKAGSGRMWWCQRGMWCSCLRTAVVSAAVSTWFCRFDRLNYVLQQLRLHPRSLIWFHCLIQMHVFTAHRRSPSTVLGDPKKLLCPIVILCSTHM